MFSIYLCVWLAACLPAHRDLPSDSRKSEYSGISGHSDRDDVGEMLNLALLVDSETSAFQAR